MVSSYFPFFLFLFGLKNNQNGGLEREKETRRKKREEKGSLERERNPKRREEKRREGKRREERGERTSLLKDQSDLRVRLLLLPPPLPPLSLPPLPVFTMNEKANVTKELNARHRKVPSSPVPIIHFSFAIQFLSFPSFLIALPQIISLVSFSFSINSLFRFRSFSPPLFIPNGHGFGLRFV